MTWDGKNRRLFVDGVKTAENTPGPWAQSAVPLHIGGIHGNRHSEDFFDGTISQVRLSKVDRYGGKNFTPETRFAVDGDTVGCWDFSEGAGTTLHDKSGHGHDGTLVGNPPPEWGEPASAPMGVAP